MAWKDGLYYQRSVRVNGRVTTRYYGRGILGQGAAVIDEKLVAAAAEKRRQAAEARQESHRAAEADRQRGEAVQDLVAIGLEALGYRRYSRNPWKRRRPSMTLALAHSPSPSDRARVAELVAEVRAATPGALAELRQMALAHPELVVRQTYADLSKLAHGHLVGRLAGTDQALNEGLRAKLRLLIAELAEGPTPPSIARRLCIEAISYSWLELWSMTCTHPDDQVRRNGAHRRLVSSLRTLAQITAAERPKPRPVHTHQVNVTMGVNQLG